MKEDKKLKESMKALEHALSFKDKINKDPFYFSGISKSFEVCLEYAWKYLKRRVIDEGIEVHSPKDAIRYAGKLKIIDNVEIWMDFLEDRNLAVHDYLGVSDQDYIKSIETFLKEVKSI